MQGEIYISCAFFHVPTSITGAIGQDLEAGPVRLENVCSSCKINNEYGCRSQYTAPEEKLQVNRCYLVTKVNLQSESCYFCMDISQLVFYRLAPINIMEWKENALLSFVIQANFTIEEISIKPFQNFLGLGPISSQEVARIMLFGFK